MKKSIMLLSIAAMVVFTSVAIAGTTLQNASAPVDVTAAAASVPIPNPAIDLRDDELLSLATPIELGVHDLSLHALSTTYAGELESPETEGPDTDGPGGPNHEFDGEETGAH